LIIFCLFFNPYVYELVTTSFSVSIEQVALTFAILIKNDLRFFYLGVATVLNPSNITLTLFLLQFKNEKKRSIIMIGIAAFIGLTWVVMNQINNQITSEQIPSLNLKDKIIN